MTSVKGRQKEGIKGSLEGNKQRGRKITEKSVQKRKRKFWRIEDTERQKGRQDKRKRERKRRRQEGGNWRGKEGRKC